MLTYEVFFGNENVYKQMSINAYFASIEVAY